MGELDDILDAASGDASLLDAAAGAYRARGRGGRQGRPMPRTSIERESIATDLFAAAARMTPELDEQYWLVAMAIHAGRDAAYLDARLAAHAAKGRPVETTRDGQLVATAPLGISSMRLGR